MPTLLKTHFRAALFALLFGIGGSASAGDRAVDYEFYNRGFSKAFEVGSDLNGITCPESGRPSDGYSLRCQKKAKRNVMGASPHQKKSYRFGLIDGCDEAIKHHCKVEQEGGGGD